jgi:hypothetical protein
MIAGVPWWVLIVILFIFFSGYMTYRTSAAEKKLVDHYIEQEGQIYMERIEKERQRKEELKRGRQVSE